MGSAPVRDHDSVKAPLTLEDVVEHVLVVAEMLALVEVVRAHDRPCATFLDSSLECRKINLIEGSVIQHGIVLMTLCLLIVKRIMLYADCDAVLLYLLDIRHYHLR